MRRTYSMVVDGRYKQFVGSRLNASVELSTSYTTADTLQTVRYECDCRIK